ncbi:MAG: hypothetical protein CMM96_03455 [Rickettsiales bacterium]|nr:hypothetical protein [Rickettsiales bacterium]
MNKEFLSLVSIFIFIVSVYLILPLNQDDIEKQSITEINNEEKQKIINNEINLSFDIIRITKNGDAVLAGRSLPGIRFELYDKNKRLAEIYSDANGEWVWTSKESLEPGPKNFNLRYLDKKGKEHYSEQSIVVIIERDKKSEPFVLKSNQNGNSNSLILNIGETKNDFSLDLAELSPDGNLMLSGRVKAEHMISLFINNEYVGDAEFNDNGIWKYKSKDVFDYKKLNLRFEIFDNNEVLRESFFTNIFHNNGLDMKEKTLVVKPGNSLWRISRKTLGGGILYTEIFKNNINIIQNPDLIYPGQVLKIPMNSRNYVKDEQR